MKSGLNLVILILMLISLVVKVGEVCCGGEYNREHREHREHYKRVCTTKRNPANLNQVTEVCEGSD